MSRSVKRSSAREVPLVYFFEVACCGLFVFLLPYSRLDRAFNTAPTLAAPLITTSRRRTKRKRHSTRNQLPDRASSEVLQSGTDSNPVFSHLLELPFRSDIGAERNSCVFRGYVAFRDLRIKGHSLELIT